MWDDGSLVGLRVQDYKSLCSAVTTCAIQVVPKLDFQFRGQIEAGDGPRISEVGLHKINTRQAQLSLVCI